MKSPTHTQKLTSIPRCWYRALQQGRDDTSDSGCCNWEHSLAEDSPWSSSKLALSGPSQKLLGGILQFSPVPSSAWFVHSLFPNKSRDKWVFGGFRGSWKVAKVPEGSPVMDVFPSLVGGVFSFPMVLFCFSSSCFSFFVFVSDWWVSLWVRFVPALVSPHVFVSFLVFFRLLRLLRLLLVFFLCLRATTVVHAGSVALRGGNLKNKGKLEGG